ncbi:MAG: helix-turn-helix domain-containing protein [Verrucomicrobia bacterium]|nr:helix-turn-helix domain-containing protein [Verrucomicrobiota bacterium]
MVQKEFVTEVQLAPLAKKFREAAGKNRAEAARELRVSRPSIIHAEEFPEKSLFKLRKRLIEQYSDYRITGPIFILERKRINSQKKS